MYCPKCGSKIDDGSAFCEECGSKIVNIAVESAHNIRPDKTEKVQSKFDLKLLFAVLLPLVSLISYTLAYVESWLYSSGYNYYVPLIIGVVAFIAMFIFDIKHGRTYKIHYVLMILSLVSALAATIVVPLSENREIFLNFSLKAFLVLPSLGLLAITFLIRFVRFVSKYHTILFILTAGLLIAFSLTAPKAQHYIDRYNDVSRAAKIEQEKQNENIEYNTNHSGEPDLAGDIDNVFGSDRVNSARTSALLYGCTSGISGLLIALDGVLVYQKAKKKYHN